MGKVTELISGWEKGTVSLTSYLKGLGYERDLLKRYEMGNWLESIGHGAYKLTNDNVNWEGAVYALQQQGKYSVHPGGKTALEFRGFAHYASQGSSRIDLFGDKSERLPKWFASQDWSKQVRYTRTNLFDYITTNAVSQLEINNIRLKVSSPELAMMELLFLVPKYYTFSESYLIMEGLTSLRSETVQKLLIKCNSIKVKRLFLYMAEKNNHSWFDEINTKKIDLGTGKRMVVKSGRLNKKYNITVPREYEE